MIFVFLTVGIVLAANLIRPEQAGAPGGASGSAPAMPDLGGARSAKTALETLQTWAATWDAKYQLIAASNSVKRQPSEGGWTFQVYSPDKKKLAIVFVEGNDVRVLQEQASLYPQTQIAQDLWVVDSDGFMNRWWQSGGQFSWTQSQNPTLYLNLAMRNTGLLTWQIAVIDEGGALLNAWEMRADTGDPLPGGQ